MPTGPREAISWQKGPADPPCPKTQRPFAPPGFDLWSKPGQAQPSISNRSGGLTFRVTSPRLCHPLGSAGIFNLLSIAYASRPRLRVRLTLGGRTFPRKPWVFGVPDSRRDYRYSCRACSLPCRPAVLTIYLHSAWNAPLPPAWLCPDETSGSDTPSRSFGNGL
jgi:hypothetical protein